MFNLDDCIGIITNRGAKNLSQAFEKRLEQYGITRTQWIALYYIGTLSDLTQKDLAEKINTTEASVARLIDRIEKNEWVVRLKSSKDRRITTLTLTPLGKDLLEQVIPVGERFSEDITKGITKEELETFKQVLYKMTINI